MVWTSGASINSASRFRCSDAVRRLIGLTGQVSAVDRQFTGEENLRLMAANTPKVEQ